MTIQKIVPKSEVSLRSTQEVVDINDLYVRQAIRDLLDTLAEKQRMLDIDAPEAGGGVGLAANQMAYPYKAMSATDDRPQPGYYPKDFIPPNIYVISIRPVRAEYENCEVVLPSVYVNATFRIDPLNREASLYQEGCLSVEGFTGFNIPRYKHITVDAYVIDANGECGRCEFSVSGFPAIVHQHEIDHGLGMEYLDQLKLSRVELSTISDWIKVARTQGISETPMWVVPDKLQCISTTPDFDALQHWVSDQIVKKDAVARIERFFAASLEKKATVSESEQDLSSGPPI